MTIGILLENLGTPASPHPRDVARYLREFLMDSRVVDIPWLSRWILVNLIITPFRAKKSAEAYQKIWTENGSPLLHISQKLTKKVQAQLGSEYKVVLGKRYGHPSIASAVAQLKDCEKIVVFPLFPQFAEASTGSALAETRKQLMQHKIQVPVMEIKDFYVDPGFVKAQAELIQHKLAQYKIDHLLFSYHGLPVRQIEKTAKCSSICDRKNVCPKINSQNQNCYRAQSYATTKALAKELNLSPAQYSTSFQSRLGRTPWIEPFTDCVLPELREKGVKNLAVVCPSFTADCLETLEEIDIRAREQWQSLGGENFYHVPCVNDTQAWVDAVCEQITQRHPCESRDSSDASSSP